MLVCMLLIFTFAWDLPVRNASAGTPIITRVTVTEDSWINPWYPGAAYGAQNVLNASTSPSNETTIIFLKFDLTSFPIQNQLILTNITLTLWLNSSSITVLDVLAAYYESNNTWSENTIKYANAPRNNISSTPFDPQDVAVNATTWNVTGIVAPRLGGIVTIVLHHYGPVPGSNTFMPFRSKQAGSLMPTLTINYEKKTSQIATSVFPSGRAVYGNPVLINATLTPALTDGLISIQTSTDGQTWSNIASSQPGANGSFIYLWIPPGAGNYYVRSTWSGDSYTTGSTSSVKALTVARASTAVSLILNSTTIDYGTPALVFVTLTPQLSEGTISTEYSTDGGLTYSSIFSAQPVNGFVFQPWFPPHAANYLLRARFIGNANYNASAISYGTLNVNISPVQLPISVSTVAAETGSSVLISGVLRTPAGTAIPGDTIQIMIRPAGTSWPLPYATLTTGSDGSFAYPWVPHLNGTFEIAARYPGLSGAWAETFSRIITIHVGTSVFPTPGQIGLIGGALGFLLGLGASFLVRFRRSVSGRRRQRYGAAKTRESRESA